MAPRRRAPRRRADDRLLMTDRLLETLAAIAATAADTVERTDELVHLLRRIGVDVDADDLAGGFPAASEIAALATAAADLLDGVADDVDAGRTSRWEHNWPVTSPPCSTISHRPTSTSPALPTGLGRGGRRAPPSALVRRHRGRRAVAAGDAAAARDRGGADPRDRRRYLPLGFRGHPGSHRSRRSPGRPLPIDVRRWCSRRRGAVRADPRAAVRRRPRRGPRLAVYRVDHDVSRESPRGPCDR